MNNAWDIGIGNTISYDANGNILDLRRGSTTKNYAYYAGTNKVQNTDGSGNDYIYDGNANVTSSSPKSINTIAYDPFTQRPTSMSMGSGSSIALQYGGDTERVMKSYNNGTATNVKLYLHGGNDYPLLEKNRVSVAAETLAVYIYGANGVIAKRVGSTVLFLLKDHLGSNRVVMDATGLVRTYYDYDVWGNIIRIGTTNEVKYQFTGQEYDESALHNYRARLYDSDLGRFYAEDPAGQFASGYIGLGNSFINGTDPTGTIFGIDDFILYSIYISATVGAIQGYNAGGLPGLIQGSIQSAVTTGFVAGVTGPVGSAVSGVGSATLTLAATSTVGSAASSLISRQGNVTTSFGLFSYDWKRKNFGWNNPFDGGGLLEGLSETADILANVSDLYKLGVKIQHQFGYGKAVERNNAYFNREFNANPKTDPLAEHHYVVREFNEATDLDANGKVKIPDDIFIPDEARYRGFPMGTIQGNGFHEANLRIRGGWHLGLDNVNGKQFWRWHHDFYDGLTLGGLGAVAHGLAEGGLPWALKTQYLFRALHY